MIFVELYKISTLLSIIFFGAEKFVLTSFLKNKISTTFVENKVERRNECLSRSDIKIYHNALVNKMCNYEIISPVTSVGMSGG